MITIPITKPVTIRIKESAVEIDIDEDAARNATAPSEPLISTEKAAALLGMHINTVKRKASRLELPHYRIDRKLRFKASELEAFRAARRLYSNK